MQAINRGLYSPGNLNFDIWHHLREASKVGGTPGEVLLVLELLKKDAATICTSCRFFRANAFEVNSTTLQYSRGAVTNVYIIV